MNFRRTVSAFATAAAFTAVPSVQAAITTFTGDTTGKPTFTRPVEDLSTLSSFGIGVHYDTLSFTTDGAGAYTFLTTGAFDTFSLLYGPTFSAAAPLVNALIANDDLLTIPITTSGFAYTLAAGAKYVLVTTGFAPTDFGAYSVTIGGPDAVITVLPEPEIYALMGAGLCLAFFLRRRSRAAND